MGEIGVPVVSCGIGLSEYHFSWALHPRVAQRTVVDIACVLLWCGVGGSIPLLLVLLPVVVVVVVVVVVGFFRQPGSLGYYTNHTSIFMRASMSTFLILNVAMGCTMNKQSPVFCQVLATDSRHPFGWSNGGCPLGLVNPSSLVLVLAASEVYGEYINPAHVSRHALICVLKSNKRCCFEMFAVSQYFQLLKIFNSQLLHHYTCSVPRIAISLMTCDRIFKRQGKDQTSHDQCHCFLAHQLFLFKWRMANCFLAV